MGVILSDKFIYKFLFVVRAAWSWHMPIYANGAIDFLSSYDAHASAVILSRLVDAKRRKESKDQRVQVNTKNILKPQNKQ